MRRLESWAPSALARATWGASRPLAAAWWGLVVVRSVLPAGLTLGLGSLVSAIAEGRSVTEPLLLVGASFALLSMSSPIHTQIGSILGDKTSGWLQAALTDACADPPGISHLERPGLFERFAEQARVASQAGRVTVLVSHRFSTVRMADLIVVMSGSTVVEVGTHDELTAHGGTYAELYAIQAAAYR